MPIFPWEDEKPNFFFKLGSASNQERQKPSLGLMANHKMSIPTWRN